MFVKALLKILKKHSYSIPFSRVIFLLTASFVYVIPFTRWVALRFVASGRSFGKNDPAYDNSLYEYFKKVIQEFHPTQYTVIADIGSGDGVIHAVNFILKDNVTLFYLVDEFLFSKTIFSKINEYLELESDRDQVKQALRLVKNSHGSLKDIPNESVDIFLSTSLFEHVLKEDVVAMITEVSAKLSPQGIAIFSVDLRDHYDFSRPFWFYQYPQWLWRLMTCDRMRYTNRLRSSDYQKIFADAGLNMVKINEDKNDSPLPKRLSKSFRHYSQDDLRTVHITVTLQKKGK